MSERGHPCPQYRASDENASVKFNMGCNRNFFSRSRAQCGQGCPHSDWMSALLLIKKPNREKGLFVTILKINFR